MSLLERYLHAVEGHLPARNRDDIVTELEEDLRAELADRAQELGRPLTEDEEAGVLKPYGRPLLMAARYWPRRYLIGPGVFPFYVTALKLVLAVALAVHVAVAIGLALAGRPIGQAAGALLNYPGAAVGIFMWVTLAFAILEFAIGQVTIGTEWDPRNLPRETGFAPRVSRLEVGFELAMAALFVVWWIALPRWQNLLFGPGAEFLALSPIWLRLHVPVLAVALIALVAKSVVLVRTEWVSFRFVAGLFSAVAGMAILATLLRAGSLVVPAAAGPESEALARAIDLGLRVSLVIAMVIIPITAGLDARRFLKGRRGREQRAGRNPA